MESLLRNFTHITIPAEIWLRRDVSLQAKCLWAEIRSLHSKEHGGCFASDEYLIEFMGLKRSRLHEIYKELKDAGLLDIVSFNGRRTVRKAVVPDVEYVEKEKQSVKVSGKPDTSNPENRIPQIRKTGFAPYIYSKEDNKVEKDADFVVEKKHKIQKPYKTKKEPQVGITQDQHDKLIAAYGKELTEACYKNLAEWKESKAMTDPKAVNQHTDYYRIKNWVIEAVQKQKSSPVAKENYKSLVEKNFKNGEQYDNWIFYTNHEKVSAVQAIGQGQGQEFFFKFNDFKEKFEHFLTKNNLIKHWKK